MAGPLTRYNYVIPHQVSGTGVVSFVVSSPFWKMVPFRATLRPPSSLWVLELELPRLVDSSDSGLVPAQCWPLAYTCNRGFVSVHALP